MAVKIFCDACQQYIRDANQDDDLRSGAICPDCKLLMKGIFIDVHKIAQRAISTIQKKESSAKAELEEAMRRVVADGKNEKELGDQEQHISE